MIANPSWGLAHVTDIGYYHTAGVGGPHPVDVGADRWRTREFHVNFLRVLVKTFQKTPEGALWKIDPFDVFAWYVVATVVTLSATLTPA